MSKEKLEKFSTKVNIACLKIKELDKEQPLWKKMVELWAIIKEGDLHRFEDEFRNDNSDLYYKINKVSNRIGSLILCICPNYDEKWENHPYDFKIIGSNEEMVDMIKKETERLAEVSGIFESNNLPRKDTINIIVNRKLKSMAAKYEEIVSDIFEMNKLVKANIKN